MASTICLRQSLVLLARSLKALLAPFGCPIQVYDPWLTDTYLRDQGVTPVDLDALLSTSRFIYVLAVPSASNKALLDREKLSLIAPDAVFLLISRSHLVDFEALTEMLLAGRFRAGIDVYPQEPLPRDHPFRHVENVILSPHTAAMVPEATLAGLSMAVDNIISFLQGNHTNVIQPSLQ